jgi:nucleotide-binding universal stress UspA family protein
MEVAWYFHSSSRKLEIIFTKRLMKNILVPTDLTEIADNGLKLAVKIAQRADARIFLINFVEAPPSSNFSVTGDVTQSGGDAANIYTIELLKKNRERLAAIASDYASDGLNIEVNVVDADFKEGVLREVKEKNIDLIVMGTTGTHNFPEYFTGNHTEQLIEHLPCPVISVKEDYIDGQLDRIVVAIDLFHEYGQKDFDHIFDLAKFFEAKVHVVYLNEKSKDAGKLKEKARAFKSAHFREAD